MSNNFSMAIVKITIGWESIPKSISYFLKSTACSVSLRNWPSLKFEPDGETLHVKLCEPIALKNWPYRSSSRKKCHILIDGYFTVQGDGGSVELLAYGTRIGYFQPDKLAYPKRVRSIDGYHFDMERQASIAHPVFHAQRNEGILNEKLNEVDLELITDENPQDKPSHRSVRLPTPQIDIVSALFMVIADHIVTDRETERQFVKLMADVREKMPLKANLNNQARLKKCIHNEEMLLDYWYSQPDN